MHWLPSSLAGVSLLLTAVSASAQQTYAHFEARHTHPIGLSPDGARLFALNSPDSRLSVFDVSEGENARPVLIAEIAVGVEPVSLRARTEDEVWVVNEVSDSLSIVSVSRRAVIETVSTPDEPADVVFAQGKAFITCARNNLVRVINAETRAGMGIIVLDGLYPRALAVNADGTRVYAAFQLSGNSTTVLPHTLAPAPPPPANAALPAPPQTALIVPANDPRISYTVTDHDVAEIDPATHAVIRYLSSVGTNLFDIAVNPVAREVWVANTEARNLVRFEPALRGHFIDHRLSRVPLGEGEVTVVDLNPGIDYGTLPNQPAQATALAQPAALAIAADGSHAWVTAFGSDRVAKVLVGWHNRNARRFALRR